MKLRKVTDIHEVEQIYAEHIAVDFPASERPPLPFFLRMFGQSASSLYLCEKDGTEVAYASFREEDGYILLNYFAVHEKQRGTGIGSEFLQEIGRLYANKKSILVEVEHAAHAVDQTDEMVRKKRIAFYERCGYVCMHDFDLVLFGTHYQVMIKPLSEDKSGEPETIYSIFCRLYNGIPDKYAAGAVKWVRQNPL